MADESPRKKAKLDENSVGTEKIKVGDEEEEEDIGFLTNISLFEPLPTELGVEKTLQAEYRPINSVNELSVLEICVPAKGSHYIDMSKSLLYIRARIAHTDKSDMVADEAVTWANIPMHSFFRQIEVTLQNEIITNGVNNNYPYKAMFDILLNFEADAKETQLQSVMYSKDTKGSVDDDDPTTTTNMGLKWRWGITNTNFGKCVDMVGPIMTDIALQDRLILNNVKITLRLFPTPHAFNITAPVRGKYKTVLEDVIFKPYLVQVSDKVLLVHDEGLKETEAQYYIKRSEIKACSINAGTTRWATDDLFCSRIPSKLLIGFVDTDAYLGDELLSPYNFQNFDLKYMNLEIDGNSYPKYPFQPDFNNNEYVEAYMSLFAGKGAINTNMSNYIERLDFPKGYALYVIPIDGYTSNDYVNPAKTGNTRLNVTFGTKLAKSVTMILYGIFDDVISIDRARNVYMESKPVKAIGGGLARL